MLPIASLALAALAAADSTPFTLPLNAGESASLVETVFARHQVTGDAECRVERAEVASVAQGLLVAGTIGESIVECTGTRHSRIAPEEGEDSPVESWTPVTFRFVVRVVAAPEVEGPIP